MCKTQSSPSVGGVNKISLSPCSNLKLKIRLTPYLYTYSRETWENSTPTVRGMILEFPNDQTQKQFMSGESLLVTPVYKDEKKRDSIYFPKGIWIDYRNGNTRFELYEDDGLTREYKKVVLPEPLLKCKIQVVNAAKGEYKEMTDKRNYVLVIHQQQVAKKVYLNGIQC